MYTEIDVDIEACHLYFSLSGTIEDEHRLGRWYETQLEFHQLTTNSQVFWIHSLCFEIRQNQQKSIHGILNRQWIIDKPR
jgi:hypothetical protein